MITLSTRRYLDEVRALREEGTLPSEVADMLIAVLNTHVYAVVPPEARFAVIQQAKETCLQEGITLVRDTGQKLQYDFMVAMPSNPETHRAVFVLVPRIPGCTLRPLSEF